MALWIVEVVGLVLQAPRIEAKKQVLKELSVRTSKPDKCPPFTQVNRLLGKAQIVVWRKTHQSRQFFYRYRRRDSMKCMLNTY